MPGKHELVVSLLTLHVPVFTILCPQRALPDSPCMQLRQSTAPATASLRIAGAGAAGAFPSLVTSSLIQTFETSSTRSRSHRLPPALPSIPLVPVTCPLRIMSAQEFMTSASVLCGQSVTITPSSRGSIVAHDEIAVKSEAARGHVGHSVLSRLSACMHGVLTLSRRKFISHFFSRQYLNCQVEGKKVHNHGLARAGLRVCDPAIYEHFTPYKPFPPHLLSF